MGLWYAPSSRVGDVRAISPCMRTVKRFFTKPAMFILYGAVRKLQANAADTDFTYIAVPAVFADRLLAISKSLAVHWPKFKT